MIKRCVWIAGIGVGNIAQRLCQEKVTGRKEYKLGWLMGHL